MPPVSWNQHLCYTFLHLFTFSSSGYESGPGCNGPVAGPAELHSTLMDQAHFVIGDQSIGQDYRSVKRVTRPMLGFKSFAVAEQTLVGMALMPMLRTGHMDKGGGQSRTAAEQFSSVAASSSARPKHAPPSISRRTLAPDPWRFLYSRFVGTPRPSRSAIVIQTPRVVATQEA